MNHYQDSVQNTSQTHDTTPMAAAAPLPTIRDTSRGPADVQRLPSLTELFPGDWQPGNAPVQRGYFPGARGPRDFPGPPSLAPSPLLQNRGREAFPPVQAPPSLSPGSQQHSPALSGRAPPLLPPMPQASEPRNLSGMYSGQPAQPAAAAAAASLPTTGASPRDMDSRGYSIGGHPPGSHSPFYGGGMPPRDYVMPPPPPPGYAAGPHGPYPNMAFEGGDFSDKKQGRRRGNLPKQVTDILRMWFQDHVAHPYPTEEEKQALMHQTGLSISQISNWFINARRRSLPRVNGQGGTDADVN